MGYNNLCKNIMNEWICIYSDFKRLAHYKFPQKSQKVKYSVFSWGKFKTFYLNTDPCKPVYNILVKVLGTKFEPRLDLQISFEV